MGVCFGVAERAPDGSPFITQVVGTGGRVAGVQRKRYLGEGEEAYTAAVESRVFEHAGTRFGVAIDPAGTVVARLPDWQPGSLTVEIPL